MATSIKKDSPPDLSDEAGTVDSGPPVNEKALLRKLDLRLLPAVGVLYLLSFLDRSNGMFCLYLKRFHANVLFLVGNARIEGMVDDLHMSKNVETLHLAVADTV